MLTQLYTKHTGVAVPDLSWIAGRNPPKNKQGGDEQLQERKRKQQELRKEKEKNGETLTLTLPKGNAPPDWGEFDPSQYISSQEEALEEQEALRRRSPVREPRPHNEDQVQIEGSGGIPNFTAKANQTKIFPTPPTRHPDEPSREEWAPPSPRKTTSSASPTHRATAASTLLPPVETLTLSQDTTYASTSQPVAPQSQPSNSQPISKLSAKQALRTAELLYMAERFKDQEAHALFAAAQARRARREALNSQREEARRNMLARDTDSVEDEDAGEAEVENEVSSEADATSEDENDRYVIVARGPTVEVTIPSEAPAIKTEAEEVNINSLGLEGIQESHNTAIQVVSAEEPPLGEVEDTALERERESTEQYPHPYEHVQVPAIATSNHNDTGSASLATSSNRRKSKFGERDDDFAQEDTQTNSLSNESEPPSKKRKTTLRPRRVAKEIVKDDADYIETKPTRTVKKKKTATTSSRAKTVKTTVEKETTGLRSTRKTKGVSMPPQPLVSFSTEGELTGDDEIVLRDEVSS